jgi:hypothetical protein
MEQNVYDSPFAKTCRKRESRIGIDKDQRIFAALLAMNDRLFATRQRARLRSLVRRPRRIRPQRPRRSTDKTQRDVPSAGGQSAPPALIPPARPRRGLTRFDQGRPGSRTPALHSHMPQRTLKPAAHTL